MFNKYAFSLAAGCQLATGANQVESGTVCIMFTAAGEKAKSTNAPAQPKVDDDDIDALLKIFDK